MLEWWIFAAVYVGVLVLAITRIVVGDLRVRRAIKRMLEVEQDIKQRAVVVKLVGEPGSRVELGHGRRLEHMLDLEAAAFRLRAADGTISVIAEGAKLTVIAPSVTFDDGRAWLIAGSELMFLADDARDDGPLRTAGALAVLPGDSQLLFSREAQLFRSVRVVHVLAWRKFATFIAACAGLLAMSAVYAPASRWNAPVFFVLVMLLLDQTLLKGSLTMFSCSRPAASLTIVRDRG